MSPVEVDQRIITSRRTLAGWIVVGAGGRLEDTLRMVREEIVALEGLAMTFPSKALKIHRLVQEWRQYQSTMRAKAH